MRQILLLISAILTGWVFASFLAWLGWSKQIEGRAFRCNDDTYPFVWFRTHLETHRRAGDTLCPGWTWERIRSVQRLYEAAYYPLCLFAATLGYLALSKLTSKSIAEPGAAPNGGPATLPRNSGAPEGPPSVS
jgi:hypothetical protein